MPRHRLVLLCALPLMLGTPPARADCELLYAPPQLRARLFAFHHANEQRRAREAATQGVPGAARAGADRRAPTARRPRDKAPGR